MYQNCAHESSKADKSSHSQSYQAFFTTLTLSTLSYLALPSALREPGQLAITRDYQNIHNSLLKLSSDWANINTTTSLCWGTHSRAWSWVSSCIGLQVELCVVRARAKSPELPTLCTAKGQGACGPGRWSDTQRHSRSQWPQTFLHLDCHGIKAQGFLCLGFLLEDTSSSCYFAN